MQLIGLTGGIASGKSTVARLLRERGEVVLSADQIARDIVQPGQPALQEIVETFGPEVLQADGTLDRAKLGSMIFADPAQRAQLDAITHPRIAEAAAAQIAQYEQAGYDRIFYEVPLLFETHMQDMFDVVILVSLPPQLQRLRLQERDQLTAEQAQRRIDSQMPLAEKQKLATYTIDNSGDIDTLRQSIDVIMQMIIRDHTPSSPL